MNNYILPIIMIALYLFFYYAAGDLFFMLLRKPAAHFTQKISLGFFLYFLLFHLTALPFKLMLRPLSSLSTTWMILAGILLIFWLFVRRKSFRTGFLSIKSHFNRETVFLLLLIMIQLCFIQYNDSTYALWDDSYYIGDISSSVYTNTISQYDPYTGNPLKKLHTEYLFETYQNHSSVMCQVFHLAPLVETRFVMSCITVILYNLIFFQIGMLLFKRNIRACCFFMLLLFLLNFFSFNLCTPAEFLFFRAYEGKTILANLVLPMIFLYFLRIIQAPSQKNLWIELFFCIFGSFGLNMSSIYMIPFFCGITFLPFAIKKKSFSVFIHFVICMLPCFLYATAYIISKHFLFFYI